MNYKTGLEDFIGKESLSKTLRNALIPTESTKIHMEEMGVIRDDELRAEKQQELKEIMDDYYRTFIEEKLGQIQGIQWNSLFQKMEETMEDISVRKDLDKIQNEKRKEICCYFTSDKRFKDLFNAKFILRRRRQRKSRHGCYFSVLLLHLLIILISGETIFLKIIFLRQ